MCSMPIVLNRKMGPLVFKETKKISHHYRLLVVGALCSTRHDLIWPSLLPGATDTKLISLLQSRELGFLVATSGRKGFVRNRRRVFNNL